MHLQLRQLKHSINKAYLKEKVTRADIERFKKHFLSLLEIINEKGDEEHLKSLVADFLKLTWYQPSYQINPIGKNDLVIHTSRSPSDPVAVILEIKSPSNRNEMISESKPNTKAIHELILYYLNERVNLGNHHIKHLITNNIFEWFVFDANEFDKKIFRNSAIRKLHQQKQHEHKDNPWFYEEIRRTLAQQELNLEVTYFDIRSYRLYAAANTAEGDRKLIPLFKILSPVHLLKTPFNNDSNTLQPKFYSELLHIIGLYEYKEGSKKLIGRKKDAERFSASLLENTIANLESHDKIQRLDRPNQYGDTYPERLYTVALELVITWVNRILFLKLLEAQLIKYHNHDPAFSFLNKSKIKDYDDLDKLFFRVLAKRRNERSIEINKIFGNVPYLNSSLFEPTELEHQTVFINNLEHSLKMPLATSTVLIDSRGKPLKTALNTLDYLFEFLNAYDFSSEGAEDIQEENKTLINASVLGLIFEKINGYKDGSFFTPGFITMYMCRDTIRRSVVAKFNLVKGWKLNHYDELFNRISDRKEANEIINSLKICDPAVGSGHFLVSALNELLAIKSDLNILMSSDGRTLRDYTIEVVNDELIVSDENGDPFVYNYKDVRSQIVQRTLFHEKQELIENCLFGVDINPNSVKICRLRLWIELLKNAYYKAGLEVDLELETLPNIDINIKTGNSLISRFSLNANLKQALKSKVKIKEYRTAISRYQNAKTKAEKNQVEQIISDIKNEFRTVIGSEDILALKKLESAYHTDYERNRLFEVELDRSNKFKIEKRRKIAFEKIDKLRKSLDDIKTNKIYQNAFEWRFEFPEALNDEGDFIGFDVLIGNPPYGNLFKTEDKKIIKNRYKTHQYKFDAYIYFMELAIDLLTVDGLMSFITPTLWLTLESNLILRKILLKSYDLLHINILGEKVFEEAVVNTCSYLLQKSSSLIINYKNTETQFDKSLIYEDINLSINYSLNPQERLITDKIKSKSNVLSDFGEVIQGITAYDSYSGQDKEVIKTRAYHASEKKDHTYEKWLDGKNLNRYEVCWDGQWISYGSWLAAPREKRFFEGERILFREVPGKNKRIQASLVKETYFYGHSISPFKAFPDFKTKTIYLLAIVNSKLLSWYGKRMLPNFGKDIFPKLNPNDIKLLPIPKEFARFEEITRLANLRITAVPKKAEEIEAQIDQLIYKIYDLTDEEIVVVNS
jgi:adenine-specific DNA-methyltransferase